MIDESVKITQVSALSEKLSGQSCQPQIANKPTYSKHRRYGQQFPFNMPNTSICFYLLLCKRIAFSAALSVKTKPLILITLDLTFQGIEVFTKSGKGNFPC